MAMTLSVVESTRPEALTTAAGELGGKVTAVDTLIETQRRTVANLRGSWQGQASEAALSRAERNIAKQTGFRDRLDQTRQSLLTAGARLGSAKAAITSIVNALRSQGWQVSDTGVATAPPTLPAALKCTEKGWTAIVQSLLVAFGRVDAEAAGSFPKFGPNVDPDGAGEPKDDEATRRKAEQDVQDALGGNAEAAARVKGVLDSITGGQRSGSVPLSAEQGSYLSQMQAQMHGMSVEDLKTAEQRLGGSKGIVGDSWQLMSNGDVRFPRTPLEVDALDDPGQVVAGGFDQVPTNVQDAIRSPGVLYGDQVKDIAGIVEDGNPALQTGTEIDRELMNKADKIMDAPIWDRDPASSGADFESDPYLDPLVSDIFDSAGRDHQIVHDHLTGPGGDDFLHDVNRHAWADDGKSAGSLFTWTEGAHGGPEAQLAAETAEKYGTYVGAHQHDLLDLPGGRTLGEVNPELVRAYAHGLGDYVPDIADLSTADQRDAFDNPDLGDPDQKIAKGIFSVLSTDETASDWFNGKASAAALAAQNEYAQAVKNHVPDIAAYNDKLLDAAALRGMVEVGTANAAHASDLNDHDQAVQVYERQKSAYEFGAKSAGTITGFVPHGGEFASTGIEYLAPALESTFIGPPPGDAPGAPIVSNLGEGGAAQIALNPLLAAGVDVPGLNPEYLVPVDENDASRGVRIGTPEEISRYNQYSVSANTWQNDLKNAVTHTVGEDANAVGSVAQRYEDIVKKPDP